MDTLEINKARAVYYGLFSSLFSYVENKNQYDKVVYTINFLAQSPMEEMSKKSFENLVSFIAKEDSFTIFQEENNNLFYSPSTSFIPVTASYYAENRDEGQKRVEMANIVLKTNFRKDTNIFKESEDHISFIFAFLQKLIEDDSSNLLNEYVLEVFSNILNSVVDEFIEKVYSHEDSAFYKDIAILLKVFMELERSLLNIEKTQNEGKRTDHEIFHQKKKGFTKKIKRNFDEVTSL